MWFSDPCGVLICQRARHWGLGTREMVIGRSLHFPHAILLSAGVCGFVTVPLVPSTTPGALKTLTNSPRDLTAMPGEKAFLGSQATCYLTVPRLAHPWRPGSSATTPLPLPGPQDPSSRTLPSPWLHEPRTPSPMSMQLSCFLS